VRQKQASIVAIDVVSPSGQLHRKELNNRRRAHQQGLGCINDGAFGDRQEVRFGGILASPQATKASLQHALQRYASLPISRAAGAQIVAGQNGARPTRYIVKISSSPHRSDARTCVDDFAAWQKPPVAISKHGDVWRACLGN